MTGALIFWGMYYLIGISHVVLFANIEEDFGQKMRILWIMLSGWPLLWAIISINWFMNDNGMRQYEK